MVGIVFYLTFLSEAKLAVLTFACPTFVGLICWHVVGSLWVSGRDALEAVPLYIMIQNQRASSAARSASSHRAQQRRQQQQPQQQPHQSNIIIGHHYDHNIANTISVKTSSQLHRSLAVAASKCHCPRRLAVAASAVEVRNRC